MKRKQLEIPAVSQSSVASVVSEASNRQQIADNFQQNQNLIANRGANITIIMQFLKQNLIKLIIILLLLSLSIWLLLYIFSQNYKISRVPSSLTADGFFSQVSQIVSQPESDYQSFKMYQKMQQLAIKTTKQNRQPSEQQYQQFDHLTFYQLYDIYKIMTTIQLAKSYFPTKQQKDSQTKQYDKQIDQINFTQYFQEVVDQHKCSSCYSFPVTATIQFMYKKHYNITIKLSEQQLIDCADQSQQNGCDDGNITKAFQYVEKVGLVQQSEYPYESIAGKSFKCKKDLIEQNITKYKISGFKTLTPRKCQEIKQQLLKNRTVAVMMNAQNLVRYQIGQTFTDCSKKGLNHAVTIVGFTKSDQWIVRNSWGKNWAEKGYFKIGRGNTCGVCSHGIVPLLKLDENQNVIKLQGDQNDQ